MLVTKKGEPVGGPLYTGKCVKCKCEVLVRESEVLEERWEGSDGYTETRRYCKCPTPLCGEEINMMYDTYTTAEEYALLVAKYGPEQ